MPIIINDYKWKQTTNDIMIFVALKGVLERNADITISKRYIKVKFEKYFFEAILLHPIDAHNSQCKITDTTVIFELKKNENITWESLQPDIPKKEKLDLKKQLLEEEYVRIQEQEKEKINKKAELKRVAVREQIELDSNEREKIEEIKNWEKTNALGDIDQWSAGIGENFKKIKKGNKQNLTNSNKQKTITHPLKTIKSPEFIPQPRRTKTLEIDFTPREFPTPSRESKLDEENEWLMKQTQARRSAGFISEDIRPEERNPQFLKAKGDQFLKNKNYLGAISAYSFGIKIASKFVDLHIARSEAHLLVGNFNKAIQDCSTALDLLKPEVTLNLKERALCIGRRGEALCKLGFTRPGIEEIKTSLKLMPDDHFADVLKTIDNSI
ncbi:dynein assembly factor 4, axonemal-like [Anoplophora glabripennis]|uniref:dynein assembly factor 4, axonemal-like n=1 Tax=Anoplophora glabripennis TaxID=217634 RepID=UPI0008737797|nr:dynein assembly factor 4, axonemal-like [Anoplophora glabripennis]